MPTAYPTSSNLIVKGQINSEVKNKPYFNARRSSSNNDFTNESSTVLRKKIIQRREAGPVFQLCDILHLSLVVLHQL
jgi:hypothetical protein